MNITGIRITEKEKNKNYIAECRCLGVSAQGRTEVDALINCRNHMILTLRSALEEIGYMTSDEIEEKLLINENSDSDKWIDDELVPQEPIKETPMLDAIMAKAREVEMFRVRDVGLQPIPVRATINQLISQKVLRKSMKYGYFELVKKD